MCECVKIFRSDYNTLVCMECGQETPTSLSIYQKVSPPDMTPFPLGYSRAKRFQKILDSVLTPAPVSADNNMLSYLYGKKFETTGDLIKGMKLSSFRDKRYMSLHLFSRLFVESYEKPDYNVYFQRRQILKEFENIQFAHWRLYPGGQFFNYAWLLCVLLNEFDLDQYIPFIKQLCCKKRKTFYADILKNIRNSYKSGPSQVYPLNSQTPPSELLGGPPKHRDQKPNSSTKYETLLRRCVRLGTCANRESFLGSLV